MFFGWLVRMSRRRALRRTSMFGGMPATPPAGPPPGKKPDPKQEPKYTPRREKEAQRIYDWRVEMFRDLGFNELQCECLAERNADWHAVKTLLDKGCPLEQAFDLST